MSEWHPIVLKLDKIGKHPNADTLDITTVMGGYPVIMKSGQYVDGDLAAYIPIDTIVPDTEEFKFLDGRRRIKARKLRGIFSMGMLMHPPSGLKEGDSIIDAFGLKKYESPADVADMMNTDCEAAPKGWVMPIYTDIEGLRKYKNVLVEGEDVIITEKLHGSNTRYCFDGERLWVGSHRRIKADNPRNMWWNVARDLNLADKLALKPKTIFYGEVFGSNVQDMKYDSNKILFRCFDTFDVTTGRYNDWDVTVQICKDIGIDIVPVLYRGPWKGYDAVESMAEGQSTLAKHIREGFVVKPITSRYDHKIGRVIMKLVGQAYHLRKEK